MDWFMMTEAETAPVPRVSAAVAETVARPAGQPRPMASGADPGRLDLALAQGVERLAETLLAGVQVAALYDTADAPGADAVRPGCSPSWLGADLDLLVQLVRLSLAAGVVLPHGVAGAPSPDLAHPAAHLAATRDCYREMINTLSRLSVAAEAPGTCRDDALRLLRQVERRVHHVDDGHPDGSARRRQGQRDHGLYDHEFIPGELLG
jgi:hypothetical protein